jgi:hypothetical protein
MRVLARVEWSRFGLCISKAANGAPQHFKSNQNIPQYELHIVLCNIIEKYLAL